MNCRYCNREGKSVNSNRQHEIRCKENPNRIEVKPSHGMLGKIGSNQYIKGTAKPLSTEARQRISEANKNQVWSKERRENLSKAMKKAVRENPESYSSSNRGRTRQQIVDGIKLQGQWEVDFYLWAKEQGLNPKRPAESFSYEWNGTRQYFPDFYIESLDLYVEVKGYETERDTAKWSQFPKELRVIKEKEIKQIRKGCFGGL